MSNEIFLNAILHGDTDYAMYAVDPEGRFLHWNASAEQILGLDPTMRGVSCTTLFIDTDKAAGIPGKELADALANGRAAACWNLASSSGTAFWVEGVVTPIYDEAGNHYGFLKILRDVTDRHLLEEEVLRAANTDALTGLANRACFREHLYEWTVAGARAEQPVILHLVDLDHFKEVNDTFGHHAGDLLLYQVGAALKALTRETDFVARLGGDEFAILQAGATSAIAASELAEKIVSVIGQGFNLNGIEAHVTSSVGIAVAPQDGWVPDELIKRADAALYRIKRSGRNGYGYFTEELDAEAQIRTQDLSALRQSVREKSFHLVYQPKVSTKGQGVVALEALLRCDHPRLREKPVGEVITLATQCGLMPRISEWVLDTACRDAKAWFDSGLPHFRVCMNLCAREAGDLGTPELLANITSRHGVSPKDFIIEVTERELFGSGPGGIAVLQEIRELGFLVAIDDFGAGYSSFNYLTTLPIDIIKLDMAFAQGIPMNLKSCIAVKGIINLANSLGLHVVAEGIERADQVDFFSDSGCESMQGYHFSRPLGVERMTAWMHAH
ncbi:MAG: EAL domain-containing protein [Herminiimonas sp.]|nr:EAL domain-containing protein [Herminiimonas sp.]